MTDDIAMRLRGLSLFWGIALMAEAADEIERLRSDFNTAIRERDEAREEVARMKKLHTPPSSIPWPPRAEAKP